MVTCQFREQAVPGPNYGGGTARSIQNHRDFIPEQTRSLHQIRIAEGLVPYGSHSNCSKTARPYDPGATILGQDGESHAEVAFRREFAREDVQRRCSRA